MDTLLDISSRRTSVVRSISRLRGNSPSPIQMLLEQRNYALGIVLLLVVVFLWTASNFVTQDIFKGGFDKPFLVTYLNTSAFSLYLLPFLAKRGWSQWTRTDRSRTHVGYDPLGTVPELVVGHPVEDEPQSSFVKHCLSPLTIRETIDLAFVFCFLWFIANWSVNASLNYTSVASATILSSMSGLFTLAIGRIFLVEALTAAKVLAVLASFGGVILVSLSDSSSSPQPVQGQAEQPLLGDMLALISAVVYALYVILLKVRIHTESRIDMQLFFGFVGLFNVLTCWIIGVVLHITGIERFELPTTRAAIGAILLNMFITLTSDYLYVLAMLKTTPLVVTIGLSLTIPLAVVGDFLLGKTTRGLVLVGALLVIASFVVVGLDDARSRSHKVDTSSIPDDLEN
ncbi:hypothetical protein D9615_005305 [Tricholomella constricta]|uniref:EamA domain-containing protein n=1 Tax=Tricholomella constricta TaxID=117010 RepID=A0A8H5M1S1_9AGAR|nr:hypothetical protein D9615_005305 [Tricholomella constricta]